MLKTAVAVLAFMLTSSAAAAGWRSLTIDGSDEESFQRSVAALQKELPLARRMVFEAALQDIWIQSKQKAEAEQRLYSSTEYFRLLDGLDYEQVVTLTDPSGATAKERYKQARAALPSSADVAAEITRARSHPANSASGGYAFPTTRNRLPRN